MRSHKTPEQDGGSNGSSCFVESRINFWYILLNIPNDVTKKHRTGRRNVSQVIFDGVIRLPALLVCHYVCTITCNCQTFMNADTSPIIYIIPRIFVASVIPSNLTIRRLKYSLLMKITEGHNLLGTFVHIPLIR